jgi:glycosyltransferase involved in cell wall biosynthesis
MKVCYLAYKSTKNTGHGIDRYLYDLISGVKREIKASIVTMDVPDSAIGWITSELTFPLKVLPAKASIYHSVSQTLAKTAIVTGKHPLITTYHDLIPVPNSLTSFYTKKYRSGDFIRNKYMELSTLIAKYSDSIIVPFNITKRDLMETLNIPESKIHIIPYGVDTTFFRPTHNRTPSLKRNKTVLLFVGGFSKAKGVEIVLKALSKVKKSFPDCELWIAGKWQLFEAEPMLKDFGIINDVKFLGHIPDRLFPNYYSAADVLVYPSKIGFGLPILEAMACGTPVIASNTADIEEVAKDSALLVNPLSVDEVCDAVLRVIANKNEKTRLSNAGMLCSKKYSVEKMVGKTLDLYSTF